MKKLFIILLLVSLHSLAQSHFKFISAGSVHTCAATDSKVVCWGINYHGQSSIMDNFKNIRQLTTSGTHTCVVDDEGSWCWGRGAYGALDFDSSIRYDSINAGYDRTCMLLNGKVQCIGKSGAQPEFSKPVEKLSLNTNMSCALSEGGVSCWDDNRSIATPPNMGKIVELTTSFSSACALNAEGRAFCWGSSSAAKLTEDMSILDHVVSYNGTICGSRGNQVICNGEIYKGNRTYTLNHPVDAMTSGTNLFCALAGGEVSCWGQNDYGQANVPPIVNKTDDVFAYGDATCFYQNSKHSCIGKTNEYFKSFGSGLSRISEIKTQNNTVCFIDQGKVICQGHPTSTVTTVPELERPVQLAVGSSHACALSDNGFVTCWGYKAQLSMNPPVQVNGATRLVGGSEHACVLKEGKVLCWGENLRQQLNVPEFKGAVTQISAGMYHTCASSDQSELKCWGSSSSSEPMESPTMTLEEDMKLVSGGTFSCAYNKNNIHCFGLGLQNQLLVPREIRDIEYVTLGVSHGCLKDADGIKCWGHNLFSQINFRTDD